MSQTYTVKDGYSDRDGRHYVTVHGRPGRAFQIDSPPLDGASVRIAGERAVLAKTAEAA